MNMIDVSATGKKVHSLLRSRYKSNEEAASILGVTHTAVAKWGRGNGMPNIDNMFYIAELFDTTVDDLVVRG